MKSIGHINIFSSHGVVHNLDTSKFLHRNLIDYNLASKFLAEKSPKYVSIDDALAVGGSALTIDDSTVASADLARLAIENGHCVTIFATGRNSREECPYVFHLLNAILDSVNSTDVFLGGARIDVSGIEIKSMIRRWVKASFSSLRTYEEQSKSVAEFASCLEVTNPTIPEYLRPLSTLDLKGLAALGVSIENHGWEHADMRCWSSLEVSDQIAMGQRYLEDEVGVSPKHFAVPFGELSPGDSVWDGPGLWLLDNCHVSPGWIGDGLYNRTTLKVL